ncbi:uncharacterized protein [Argopecten irradians]|uniref:uncharacterized protein isoform X3 n=1 Tax=Argopecten irradians TaxID=31199 RepID=UPI003712E987
MLRAVLSIEESLRSLVESLLGQMERQDARLQQMEKTIQNNVDDLKRKDVRIHNLERELDKMKNLYRLQTPEHKDPQNEVPDTVVKNDIPHEEDNITESMISRKKLQDAKQRHVRVPPKSPDEAVGAFSVSLNKETNLQGGFILKYDQVNLDMGDNYNMADGVYIVPVTGVYVFTWSCTSTTADVDTELIVDGSSRGTLLTEGDNNHWDHTTGFIVTPVSAGDHVFVRAKGNGHMYGSVYHGGPSFSGWRLS